MRATQVKGNAHLLIFDRECYLFHVKWSVIVTSIECFGFCIKSKLWIKLKKWKGYLCSQQTKQSFACTLFFLNFYLLHVYMTKRSLLFSLSLSSHPPSNSWLFSSEESKLSARIIQKTCRNTQQSALASITAVSSLKLGQKEIRFVG